nr:T9SS type A sorting domain-containing protein [Chitinophagales bacterium]
VTKTASGCFKNSNTIIVTVPCKEGEELIKEENNNFTIFPNPNTGTFNLVYNVPTGAISPLEGGPRGVMTMLEIFNSLGQQIYSQQINSPDGNINETISINNLSSGIYFVRIGNGNVYSQQKLIIE